MLHVLISSKVNFVTDQTWCHPWPQFSHYSSPAAAARAERRNQAGSPTLTWLGWVTVCLVYNLGDFTDFGKNKYWPNLFVVYGRLFVFPRDGVMSDGMTWALASDWSLVTILASDWLISDGMTLATQTRPGTHWGAPPSSSPAPGPARRWRMRDTVSGDGDTGIDEGWQTLETMTKCLECD